MDIKEIELLKNQSEALGVQIEAILIDPNRYAMHIGSHSYTDMHSALSAITTIWLKDRKC